MSKLIYIDTNIWLDHYGDRKTKYISNGELARQIVNRGIDCEFNIVVSDLVMMELKKYLTLEMINDMLLGLRVKNKIKYVKFDKTKLKSKLHYPDSAHVYMAKQLNCDYFLTNDKEILKHEDFAISSRIL